MPKQMEYIEVAGGRKITTPGPNKTMKVGSRSTGKAANQLSTEELNLLLGRKDNRKYHHRIRKELGRRG